VRTLIVLGMVVAVRSAFATGLCENVGPRYDPPELFDEATQSFAINVSQPWCEQIEDHGTFDEKRGTVAFVELRDIHSKVIGRLSAAQGEDADHLRSVIGDFDAIAVGKLHTTLLARGYKPVVAPKSCKLTTAWTDVASGGGWRAASVQLDVMRAGKQLVRTKLGDGSIQRRGDQVVRAHALAKQKAFAVFAIVPACAGPPPGYFGPEDGGDCYHVDTPVVMLLAAPACF